jgi:hypothetical protein
MTDKIFALDQTEEELLISGISDEALEKQPLTKQRVKSAAPSSMLV